MKNAELNKYKISWAILFPVKGKSLKHDNLKINKYVFHHNGNHPIKVHAPCKEDLLLKLNSFKGKLRKQYNVLIISDAQISKVSDSYTRVATSKQLEEVFTL